MFLSMFIILNNHVVLDFCFKSSFIRDKASGNLKIKEEALFYFVNKIF